MDFLVVFQIALLLVSGLYSYVLLPLLVYLGLRQLIREWKKKDQTMSYTHDVIKIARTLSSPFIVDYDEYKNLYTVRIDNTMYREKQTYFRCQLDGTGRTIEDSCQDFLRKCRGGILTHIINNKECEPL